MTTKDWLICAGIFLLPIMPPLLMPQVPLVAKVIDPYQRSLASLKDLEFLWVDARTQRDFDKKHIPNAILVNFDDWEVSLERLFAVYDPTKAIVVYCGPGCSSSKTVAQRLRQVFVTENIYFLKGGMEVWFKEHK